MNLILFGGKRRFSGDNNQELIGCATVIGNLLSFMLLHFKGVIKIEFLDLKGLGNIWFETNNCVVSYSSILLGSFLYGWAERFF